MTVDPKVKHFFRKFANFLGNRLHNHWIYIRKQYELNIFESLANLLVCSHNWKNSLQLFLSKIQEYASVVDRRAIPSKRLQNLIFLRATPNRQILEHADRKLCLEKKHKRS